MVYLNNQLLVNKLFYEIRKNMVPMHECTEIAYLLRRVKFIIRNSEMSLDKNRYTYLQAR